jgi:hypothetical protein
VQGKNGFDFDAVTLNPKEDTIGKSSDQCSSDIREDQGKRFWVLKNPVESMFDAEHEVIAKSGPDAVVPFCRLEQIGFGRARDDQRWGHFGLRIRCLTSCQVE